MDPGPALATITLVALVGCTVWALIALGKLVFRFWNWVEDELQRRQH